MSLLLHRSPFVDTSAGPADVQSLNKFLHQITATLLLQSTLQSTKKDHAVRKRNKLRNHARTCDSMGHVFLSRSRSARQLSRSQPLAGARV